MEGPVQNPVSLSRTLPGPQSQRPRSDADPGRRNWICPGPAKLNVMETSPAPRLKVHRRSVWLDRLEYTILSPRPTEEARFATNYFHETWHVITSERCSAAGSALLGDGLPKTRTHNRSDRFAAHRSDAIRCRSVISSCHCQQRSGGVQQSGRQRPAGTVATYGGSRRNRGAPDARPRPSSGKHRRVPRPQP